MYYSIVMVLFYTNLWNILIYKYTLIFKTSVTDFPGSCFPAVDHCFSSIYCFLATTNKQHSQCILCTTHFPQPSPHPQIYLFLFRSNGWEPLRDNPQSTSRSTIHLTWTQIRAHLFHSPTVLNAKMRRQNNRSKYFMSPTTL